MSTLNLSRSTLEQLLAARRQIRLEFNETLHLSDENLEQQLHHYRQLSSIPETQTILDACLTSLGTPPHPITTIEEPALQSTNLPELLERAEAAKKLKNDAKWSQMGSAASYFD